MPRNGSGQYNLPYDWNDDKANGIKVLASRMQSQDQDIANALTQSISKDGQTAYTGNQNFNNNKIINLANGSDALDSVNISQVQTGALQFYGISSTTPLGNDGEDYTLGPTPSIDTYPTYNKFSFVCHFTCIANPVMKFGDLADKILKKSNGSGGYIQLVAGDIVANKEYQCIINNDVGANDIIVEDPEYPVLDRLLLPIGSAIVWLTTTPPINYLEGNGAAISRTTYSSLFSVIGTTFGSGDGSTTFNLPDFRGYFVRGWDNGRGVDSGRIFGSNQADDFKAHTHTGGMDTIQNLIGGGAGAFVHLNTQPLPNTGSTGGTETRPINISLMFCVKYQ